jgi:hypothetical protein
MWFVNLGQFVLGLWMAFSGSVGSLDDTPALRSALVFLTYAVLLPVSLSNALRACIPIGHFVGVEDNDFLPFRNLLDLCRKGVGDLHATSTRSASKSSAAEGDAPDNILTGAADALNMDEDDSEGEGEGEGEGEVHGSVDLSEKAGSMRPHIHPADRDGTSLV